MSAPSAVSSTALLPAALRALRAIAADDHARADDLRRRSGDHSNSRRANKPRAYRLRVRSLRAEARAREMREVLA